MSDGGPPVANGLYMSPGSPTGSDVSDSSTIPVLPSVGLFRPVPRAGGPLLGLSIGWVSMGLTQSRLCWVGVG